jgi:hypothetical protein
LVSDGAGEKFTLPNTKIVGTPLDNCGIVDLEVRDPFPEKEAEISATIRNAGIAPRHGTLRILREDQQYASVDFDLAAGAETRPTLAVARGAGGSFRASLEPADALTADDDATFLLAAPVAAPIVLAKTNNGPSAYLEAAARALAAELDVPLFSAGDARSAPADAVILQEGGSLTSPPQRAILFGTSVPGLAAPAAPAAEPEPIVRFDGNHPFLAGILLDRLRAIPTVTFDPTGAPAPGAVSGARAFTARGPALLISTKIAGGDARAVAWSFELANSNFPALDGAFPVFLRRAFLWLAEAGARSPAVTRAGEDPMAPLEGRPARGPGKVGPWRLPSGAAATASLLDARTTDLAPGLSSGDPSVAAGTSRGRPLTGLVAWAAAIAFGAALALERTQAFRERAAFPRITLRRGSLPRRRSTL